MSEKTEKIFRRLAKKTLKYYYKEFLEDVAELGFRDRCRIAWQVIVKGKYLEK